jgi:hypothetical protein
MQKMTEPLADGAGGGGLESPSLFDPNAAARPDSPAAYEVKFLIPEDQARAILHWLGGRLALDPYADPALDGAYHTTSLYTDTPQFDVFRRVGEFGACKYRVRRYGTSGPVFLERKEKDGQRVRKCRATVPPDELALIAEGKPRHDWVGEWFRTQTAERALRPVCRVSYERVAFMGHTDAGAVRVTFDRNIRGEAAESWEPVPVGPRAELLPGRVVCEFKFRVSLPAMLKELIETYGLTPTTASKYRRFIRAAGLAGTTEAVAEEGNPSPAPTGEERANG